MTVIPKATTKKAKKKKASKAKRHAKLKPKLKPKAKSKVKRKSARRVIVGWREWVGLPDLGIAHIKAKIDTGARTSALHALHIEPFERDGEDWVRFLVHPLQKVRRPEVACEARVIDERWITDSGGNRELRYIVETTLHLAGEDWPMELSLTHRGDMGFRLLIGRTALRKHYVIDPGRSFYTDSKPKKKRHVIFEKGPRK